MSQERPPLLQVYTHFIFSRAFVSQDRPPLLQVYTHFKFSRAFVSQDRPLLTTNKQEIEQSGEENATKP
jgi:hypothetical protein